MLVKTEKQKMPFVPNFRMIFVILAIFFIFSLILALRFWPTLPIILIILVTIILIWRKILMQRAEKLIKEYEDFENFSGNQLEFLRKRQNILQILWNFKKKIPIPEIDIETEKQKNSEAIEHFLETRKNENIAISHIADELNLEENARIIKNIPINFSKHREDLRRFWMMELAKINNFLRNFSCFLLIFPPLWIILLTIFIRSWWKASSFESWHYANENSEDYEILLKVSAFYHSKLDDFYNFVFHENNFLPETPLLFADIITLMGENFEKRRIFLEEYRLLWGNWLKIFFAFSHKLPPKIYTLKIFQRKIPDEVEAIISEEEENLENEIKNIQNKIREWAEFEKNKIATISSQNKEFFPNLELSNKRQEMLIKNFEKIAK